MYDYNSVTVELKIKQRQAKRVLLSYPTNIKSIIIARKKLLQLNNQFFMKAKDISLSGILLESPLDIPMSTNFIINLRIDNSYIILKTTTIRKYIKDNLYYYGCTFSLNSKEDQNLLLYFINKNHKNDIKTEASKISYYCNNSSQIIL